jgi:hypothetical protein
MLNLDIIKYWINLEKEFIDDDALLHDLSL